MNDFQDSLGESCGSLDCPLILENFGLLQVYMTGTTDVPPEDHISHI